METALLKDAAGKYLMNTYGERAICLARGEGCRVWDSDGKEYLDFLSGISVNNLGHCHPAIVAAIQKQAATLIHCSNIYLIEPQILLAKKIVENSFANKCFFANSGAEANEGAIKLARLYSKNKYQRDDRFSIIAMKQSFHGRTMGTISATGQSKVQVGFEPLLEGFVFAEFNNIESVRALVNEKTCAVILEPVQGEGGIIPADKKFLEAVRALCNEKDLVLIFDEVQCGMGRIGTNFAYEYFGVTPDVITLAKALGGGVPIGALLARAPFSDVFSPGKHAHTFGGNPLVCSAALAFVTELFDKKIAARAAETGEFFRAQLRALAPKYSFIKDVRGLGLMIGIALSIPGKDIVSRCMEKGLLANCTCDTIIRMLPPLIVSKEDCDKAVKILDEVFSTI
ncbi:MAG: Acetylornithine aminotransferase [candidate division BRC1 bacterium ADurb.Bin183]|nr:MAG: Acetylornithine aminotransferase [candidate division BRC1 bacterium ADurb.Bin183]